MDVNNLIAGRWTAGAETMEEVNPSTGAVLHRAPRSGKGEIAEASAAAANAFPAWAATPAPVRGEMLFRAAAAVDSRREQLASAMVEEVGKPIKEAEGEVARTSVILRYFAGDGRRSGGLVIPSDTGDFTITMRDPVGVVGLITPWNFPLAIPAWKLGPCLVAGNTVVLKPAEESSALATMLGECFLEAGIPEGVLNIVCGDGEAGKALIDHPEVRAVSFTGSLEAGASVRKAAAARGIRVQLEMGGKNVAIVLPDADLERAAGALATGAFGFAGQKCTATGLALIDGSIQKEFFDAITEATAKVGVGEPSDQDTACGPVIRTDAADRAEKLGAHRREGDGFFVEPVLVPDVSVEDPIAQNEIFAPVLPLATVSGLDEALEVANRLPTGLSAGIHTRDSGNVLKFLRSMKAGVLAVNRPTTGLEVQAPFGGLKASGSEHKEQGPNALDFYTQIKTAYWTA